MRVIVDAAGVTKPAGNSGWSLAVYGMPSAANHKIVQKL